MYRLLRYSLTFFAIALFCAPVSAANGDDETPVLGKYYNHATSTPAIPNKDGFVTRWALLEPISKPLSSNRVFTDSYLREAATTTYFNDQFTLVPYDGQKTIVGKEKLIWHALDSKNYFINLLRFAEGYDKEYYGQVYWVVTTINCESDIENVRLSSGANSAAMWYLDGKEVLMLSNDRDLIVDDCMSKKLTLKKGENVLRGAIFTGPGMATFCLRFVDETGKPIKNFTVTTNMSKKK